MAHAALASLGSSLPAAAVIAAGLAFVWLAVVLALLFAAGRLSMPDVAVLGTLGAVVLALLFLWATADGGQP
jgi:hypothetical protein